MKRNSVKQEYKEVIIKRTFVSPFNAKTQESPYFYAWNRTIFSQCLKLSLFTGAEGSL